MRGRSGIFAAPAAGLVAAAVAVAGVGCGGGGESKPQPAPGEPRVEVISPRNGARQASRAVVVKLRLHNFQLAPGHFGGEPELGEGNIRFSLNRVPDCVEPAKLEKAVKSPIGNERLEGASFDYPQYAGPNGVLAEQIGSAGSYSPATRPEIYYHALRPGLYREVITLAQNNGATTPYHAVTTFRVLPRPGHGPPPCTGGKVSTAKAAVFE